MEPQIVVTIFKSYENGKFVGHIGTDNKVFLMARSKDEEILIEDLLKKGFEPKVEAIFRDSSHKREMEIVHIY